FTLLPTPSPSTSAIVTLSLHDALPIYPEAAGPLTPLITRRCAFRSSRNQSRVPARRRSPCDSRVRANRHRPCTATAACRSTAPRSEEHTSELQSRFDLVCRLLLEKKRE